MKFHRILLVILLAPTLVSCGVSQSPARQSQPQPAEDTRLQKGPLQEPSMDSPESDPTLSKLPAPTVGSVVITNTTRTLISTETSTSALTPTPDLQELAEEARRDLARRLNIDVVHVELDKIVPAKWPYDSIGCPLPTGESIDTSASGYQIILKANDQQYMYHTDGEDWVGLCSVKPPNEIRTLP
jgi:hypothetical protein